MSVINAVPLLAAAGGDYQISRSVRLRSSATAYFNRTLTTPTSQNIWSFSCWLKRGSLADQQFIFWAGTSATNDCALYFSSSDQIGWFTNNGSSVLSTSTAVFRDPSAWYHIVAIANSTTMNVYVNNQQVITNAGMTNNTINSAIVHNIGRDGQTSGNESDGYLTEINFIDGQALTPSSFGENDTVTGVWKPKKYAGTYGTNGFYLDFSDNSNNTAATIGKDYSGNGNNWTPNNISVTSGVTYDSMLDVPTNYADGGNGRGNYCVLNTLDKNANVSILNGNLNMNTSAVNYGVRGSIGVNSGKWYWEAYVSAIGSTNVDVGIADSAWDRTYVGSASSSWGYFSSGQKYNNATATSYGATYTTGDTIGVAFDADAGTLTFYKNGTSQGQAFSGVSSSNPIFPAVSGQTSSTLVTNFGQRPFTYTPPSGFVALNTQNLPDSTIKRGGSYFNSVLYTGNAGNQSITGVGFQPDLVWGKLRSTSGNHRLHDSLRGSDNTLSSNLTDAEVSGNGLVSFDADGFTMDSGTNINQAYTYVSWNWKESATAGFDIVTYTGTGVTANTVSHSLGVTPSMVIVKSRSAAKDWFIWHKSLSSGYQLRFTTAAQEQVSSATTDGGLGTPNSSTFGFISGSTNTDNVNQNGVTYVAYLFAEVAGYSAFGSYTGNGSTDGPFIYTGFRPRFILTKCSSLGSLWAMWDTSRNTYNAAGNVLQADSSSAEISPYNIDILSNGFKFRDTNSNWNSSGATFIYAAFAESPYKLALAR